MTRSLRALIADDEPIARRRLARLLGQATGVSVIGEAGDGDQTVRAVQSLRPDLLLLDVQMPGGDGFSVFDRLGKALPPVIFVTAFDHYARRAFDAAAIDYLTKPVEMPRLIAALSRARLWIGAGDREDRIAGLLATIAGLRASLRAGQAPARDLWIKGRSGHQRIAMDDIVYIKAERDYARIVVADTSHLVPETIQALAERLADSGFLRIHRSVLVRRDAVRGLGRRRYGALVAILADGTELPVSRSHATLVQREFGLKPV
ncbi:LytR/AlgR family response regulator transcription factor [Paracoccus sp. (in: a-proteobacteria)]|uniref:LytR/AlgR family response regulator transcription factor n=1 Tax=Paracoccus sp. TaxID=267 RepID=UPI003A863C2E